MTNVIKAEDKFSCKGNDEDSCQEDSFKNSIKKAKDLIASKNVWFDTTNSGIFMEGGLQELLDDSVGKEYSDSYLLFCICQFATGEFGEYPEDIKILRLNNLIKKRRVQGRYPINPEKDFTEKGNEFWIAVDDGHRKLVAMTAEELETIESFYNTEHEECPVCDEE